LRESFAVSSRRPPQSDCALPGPPGTLGPTRFHTKNKKDTGVFVSLISYLPTAISALFVLAAGLLLGFIQ
jgi:hypothetical protein